MPARAPVVERGGAPDPACRPRLGSGHRTDGLDRQNCRTCGGNRGAGTEVRTPEESRRLVRPWRRAQNGHCTTQFASPDRISRPRCRSCPEVSSAHYLVPSIYAAGVLMTYGPNQRSLPRAESRRQDPKREARRSPIEQSTEFQLAINIKTAKHHSRFHSRHHPG